jgi:hypothetical protein
LDTGEGIWEFEWLADNHVVSAWHGSLILIAAVLVCPGFEDRADQGQGGSPAIRFSGKLTDRAGDSTKSTQLPKPPDFVAATIEVSSDTLTLTVSFAPGTLSEQTGMRVYLDTDEDVKTGAVTFPRERNPIGADYAIRGVSPHVPTKAALTRETAPSQSTFLGPIDVTSPAPDKRRIVLPLARLGNDDGRLLFKLECYAVVATSADLPGQTRETNLQYLDFMPNRDEKPGRVGSGN